MRLRIEVDYHRTVYSMPLGETPSRSISYVATWGWFIRRGRMDDELRNAILNHLFIDLHRQIAFDGAFISVLEMNHEVVARATMVEELCPFSPDEGGAGSYRVDEDGKLDLAFPETEEMV